MRTKRGHRSSHGPTSSETPIGKCPHSSYRRPRLKLVVDINTDLGENKGSMDGRAVRGEAGQSFVGATLSLKLLHSGVYAASVNTKHNHRKAGADTRSTATVS
jgi:hypothetical protein